MMPGFDRFRIAEAHYVAARVLDQRGYAGDATYEFLRLARLGFKPGAHCRFYDNDDWRDAPETQQARRDGAEALRRLKREARANGYRDFLRRSGHLCVGCVTGSWCRGGDCENNAVAGGTRPE